MSTTHVHEEVAPAPAAQVGHAGASDALDVAGLGARRPWRGAGWPSRVCDLRPRCPARPGPRSTFSVVCRSSPRRSKRGSGVTARWTNSEPFGPPALPGRPALGQAQRRAVLDAGRHLDRERACPRSADPRPGTPAHGCGMISPEPRSASRPRWSRPGRAATGGPGGSRRRPGSPGRSAAVVPGAVPTPAHAVADTGRRTESSLRAPKTASANSRPRRTSASAPAAGRAGVPPRAAHEPKNASKMSPRPPSKSKPPIPPPADWPKTPSGPKRS